MKTNTNAPIEALLDIIGENMKQRAKQNKLDQKTLAQLADLNRNTVSAALSGNDIRLSTLIRLTRVIGYSDWLIPLLETPTPSPMETLSKTKKRLTTVEKQNKPNIRKLGRRKGNW